MRPIELVVGIGLIMLGAAIAAAAGYHGQWAVAALAATAAVGLALVLLGERGRTRRSR
jgi:hypothetical protein